MQIDIHHLLNNALFTNIDSENLKKHLQLESCVVGNYKKGTLIVQEGDPCNSIGLVIDGILAIQQLTPSGECLTIKMFQAGDAFGTALFNMQNATYPFTLITLKRSRVLYIPFCQIHALLQNDLQFSQNFIAFLSERVLSLKNKLQMLQHKDVRSRLIFYLSSEYKKAGLPSFKISHKKVEIAEIIGVARPSVSRELRNMESDQLIQLNGKYITLLKPELFHHA